MIIESVFGDGDRIPAEFTCDGKNVSPPLKISEVPENAKSLALIMHDPDAPMRGGFTHWVSWNIPVDIEGIKKGSELPDAKQGMNGAKKKGYTGPCPPAGVHRYIFRIYALDKKLRMSENSGKKELEAAMKNHVVGECMLTGIYGRDW